MIVTRQGYTAVVAAQRVTAAGASHVIDVATGRALVITDVVVGGPVPLGKVEIRTIAHLDARRQAPRGRWTLPVDWPVTIFVPFQRPA